MLTETAFRTLRPACRFPPPKSAGSSLNLRSRRCPVLPGLAKGPLARFDESSHGGLSASCAKDDVFGDALANVVPVAAGPAATDPFKCPVHTGKSAEVEAVCDHFCCPRGALPMTLPIITIAGVAIWFHPKCGRRVSRAIRFAQLTRIPARLVA